MEPLGKFTCRDGEPHTPAASVSRTLCKVPAVPGKAKSHPLNLGSKVRVKDLGFR